jgi:hypothetical protein
MYRPQFPAPLAPVWPKRNINLRRAQGPPLKRLSLANFDGIHLGAVRRRIGG